MNPIHPVPDLCFAIMKAFGVPEDVKVKRLTLVLDEDWTATAFLEVSDVRGEDVQKFLDSDPERVKLTAAGEGSPVVVADTVPNLATVLYQLEEGRREQQKILEQINLLLSSPDFRIVKE